MRERLQPRRSHDNTLNEVRMLDGGEKGGRSTLIQEKSHFNK